MCTPPPPHTHTHTQIHTHFQGPVDNGNGPSSLIRSFTTWISAHILYIEKIKMAARSPQPTEAETVALLEKAIPENTKRATKYGVKYITVYLRK